MTSSVRSPLRPLDPLFRPRSVAVVGASNALDKPGGRRWRTLIEGGFKGSMYPVHPTATEVLGHRAYRTLSDLPERVDLAVIIVRADVVPSVARECAALQVPAVVVITGGFGEAGDEGRRSEEEIVGIIRGGGGRVIGPNCAGVFSAAAGVNVLGWKVAAGSIALISQSGNMTLSFMQLASHTGLGFSKMITVGNAADLGVPDYIDYLEDDDETRAIIVYVEGFRTGEGRRLYDVIARHRGRKPVLFIKPGETASGRRAALSHTGSLAGERRVVKAALRQCGALLIAETEDAWNAAVALSQLPPMNGDSIVVVSDGGGHATVVCDTAARVGLSVPTLSPATVSALTAHLPPRSGVGNPVDFAGAAEGEPEVVPRVLDICLADVDVEAVIFAGHFGGYFRIATPEIGRREEAVAHVLVDIIAKHRKPFILHTIYAREQLATLAPIRSAGIPILDSLEAAAKAMGIVAEWGRITRCALPKATHSSAPDMDSVGKVLRRARGRRPMLIEPDARELAQLYGLPASMFRTSLAAEQTAAAAREFGDAVAIKLVSADVIHKSDVGAVILDVRGAEAAIAAHHRLMDLARQMGANDACVLVTPMVRGGVEMVVGGLRDPQFGAVVMVGLGGIGVEVLQDVAFGVAPVDAMQARALIDGLRAGRLLQAYRGRPALDVDALIDILVRTSEMLADNEAILEVDFNPVFLLPDGAVVADARVILS